MYNDIHHYDTQPDGIQCNDTEYSRIQQNDYPLSEIILSTITINIITFSMMHSSK
jgi:hypothetical protein